ncbi:MAG: hypothetical protein QOJ07_329 [Thermoleophilaceae bacterium]|nr:hypothetical protein [Thermoleophilaceae bacterium]
MRSRSRRTRILTTSLCAAVGTLVAVASAQAAITAQGQDFGATAGQTFSGTVAHMVDTTPSNVSTVIDWGDGTAASIGTLQCKVCNNDRTNADVTGTHTYAQGGGYEVTVTFTGSDGDSAQAVGHAAVVEPPPRITVTGPSEPEGSDGVHDVSFTVALSRATDKPVSVDWSTSDLSARGWALGPPQAQTYTDLQPGTAFHDEVEALTAHGVVTGYADGTFRPKIEITRGQLAHMVWKAMTVEGAPGAPVPGPTPIFTDVSPGSAFYAPIEFIGSRGIASGYADGTFRPSAGATRAQLAKQVDLAIGGPAGPPPPTPTFSDVPTTHPFYPFVEDLAARGVVSGFADGTFRPLAGALRGQAAKVVALALHPGDYAASSGTVSVPAGQTGATFAIPVYGDTAPEGDDQFQVSLANAANGTLVTPTAAATLQNDDPAPPAPTSTSLGTTVDQLVGRVSGRPIRVKLGNAAPILDLGHLSKAPLPRTLVVNLLPLPRHSVATAAAKPLAHIRIRIPANHRGWIRVPLGRKVGSQLTRKRTLSLRLGLELSSATQAASADGVVTLRGVGRGVPAVQR